MAKQTINLGTGELTGDGESIRSAFDKINDNFDELYSTEHNLSSISQSIIPDTDVAYDLGSASNRFRDLYLSGSTIDLGGASISAAPDGSLILPGTTIPVWEPVNIDYYEDSLNPIPISESFGVNVPVLIDQVTYLLCRPENQSERLGATPATYQPVLDGNGVITSINIIDPGSYPTVGELWQDVNTDNMWALPPDVNIGDWNDIYAAVDNIETNGNDPYGVIWAGVRSEIVGSRTAPNPISGQQTIDGSLIVNGPGTFNGKLQILSTPPATSKGAADDVSGQVAFDNFYIYYCTAAYTDGVADIWKRVAWSGDTW